MQLVAPSRVRGLKQYLIYPSVSDVAGRTLTGAWIEAPSPYLPVQQHPGRTLTGAWIEASGDKPMFTIEQGRTLTGAWIEAR